MAFQKIKKAAYITVLCVVVRAFMPCFASAQISGATLSGAVTDPTGAAVPQAKIKVQNDSTKVVRTSESDHSGVYAVPNLLPGVYTLTVMAPGFKTSVTKDILLTVGAEQVSNIAMQLGQVSESIVVESTAAGIDLGTSSLNNVLDAATIRDLPLNGRSWSDLAQLQPGVTRTTTQNSANGSLANRGYGAESSISGTRPQQNNYRLDGVSLLDYTNSAGSMAGGNLGVDAIDQFSVITSNYSAEYGKTSGGVINALSRAGTNTIHGSAYEFARNSALDSRAYLDSVTGPPPFSQNQFGFSAGGPLKKDRTFLFGAFESLRYSRGSTSIVTVPSAQARTGALSIGTVTVDPYIRKFLNFYPLPNAGLAANGDTGKYSFAPVTDFAENFASGRFDRKLSEKDSLFATYQYDRSGSTAPDSFNDILYAYNMQRQFAVAEYNHVFSPQIANTLRLGYTRNLTNNNLPQQAINPLASDDSLGPSPGVYAPQAIVSPLDTLAAGFYINSVSRFAWNTFQVYDDAFITAKSHIIKFGVAFERDQLNQVNRRPGAAFTFQDLPSFLQNKPKLFTQPFPGYVREFGIRQTIAGAYVQDDWHLVKNVTVNLGLRYEASTVPNEVHGDFSNLINITDPLPKTGNPIWANPTLKDFSPRVGAIWDIFGNGKTALRSGFGLFDNATNIYNWVTLDIVPAPYTFTITNSSPAQGSMPGGSGAVAPPANQLNYVHVDPNPKRNYVMQWNMNIQPQLAKNLTATVAYVGSRALHQPFRSEYANIIMPKMSTAGYVWPISGASKINTNVGGITYLDWSSSASYNALQVAVTRNFTKGFQGQVSYTWGKNIDTGSSVISGDQFTNSISNLPTFDPRLRRGLSDYDVRRNLVVSGFYEIPSHVSGWKSDLLNGWQMGTILLAKDGTPFTPVWARGGDPLGIGGTVAWIYPNRNKGPGCESGVNPGNPNAYIKTQCFSVPTAPNASYYSQYCKGGNLSTGDLRCFNLLGNAGRNSLIGPGYLDLDFSLYKNNRFEVHGKAFNVQTRIEFFNIINHTNYQLPGLAQRSLFDAATGNPTSGAGALLSAPASTPRQIQLAIKGTW